MRESAVYCIDTGCRSSVVATGGRLQAKGTRWSCFFTNDGVNILAEPGMQEAACCAQRVVVCEHSWARFMGDKPVRWNWAARPRTVSWSAKRTGLSVCRRGCMPNKNLVVLARRIMLKRCVWRRG